MSARADADAIVKAMGGKWRGDSASCKCPAHDDRDPSLSVSVNNGTVLVHCHAGCSQDAVIDALRSRGLWPNGERDERRAKPKAKKPAAIRTRVFEYRDEAGKVLFETVREEFEGGGKNIFQRRTDARGRAVLNLKGVRLVVYRLPELIAAIDAGETVYVVEGEAKVSLLTTWGLPATCNPLGARKWRAEYAEPFRRRKVPVVILPDNDEAGREHARRVAANLHPVAESVRIVELPRLGPGGDVVDFAAGGGSKELLLALIAATPEWHPADPPPEPGEPEPAAGSDEEQPEPEGAAAEAGGPGHDPEAEPAAAREKDEGADRAPPFSVEALALDFAAKHARELRYVAEWSRWFRWRGSRWAVDSILWAFHMARVVCRAAAALADDKAMKMRLTDGKTEAAVERLAKADPRLAAEIGQWDADPLLLNMEVRDGDG